jgi:hypothetical protein
MGTGFYFYFIFQFCDVENLANLFYSQKKIRIFLVTLKRKTKISQFAFSGNFFFQRKNNGWLWGEIPILFSKLATCNNPH